MGALNDPELLHVLKFEDDHHGETRILFVIAEKSAWFGDGGFELFVTADILENPQTFEVRRMAGGPSFVRDLVSTSIFGGDRATVFLPDPFPHHESQRKLPELYWFWPSGTMRYVLHPLPVEDYELLPLEYRSYHDMMNYRSYMPLFTRKQLTS